MAQVIGSNVASLSAHRDMKKAKTTSANPSSRTEIPAQKKSQVLRQAGTPEPTEPGSLPKNVLSLFR